MVLICPTFSLALQLKQLMLIEKGRWFSSLLVQLKSRFLDHLSSAILNVASDLF